MVELSKGCVFEPSELVARSRPSLCSDQPLEGFMSVKQMGFTAAAVVVGIYIYNKFVAGRV